MTNLTSEGAFELALIFAYAFGGFAIACAILSPTLKRLGGPTYRGAALVPLAIGLGMILILLVLFGRESLGIPPTIDRLSPIWTVMAAGATVFLVVAVGTLVLFHIPEVVGSMVAGRRRLRGHRGLIGQVGTLAVGAAVILGATNLAPVGPHFTGANHQPSVRLIRRAQFELDAPLLGLALRDARSGYLALANQGIFVFEMSDGEAQLEMTKVADAILPRGMLVKDGTLFATSVGPYPCLGAREGCSVGGDSFPRADGTIIAFGIQDDGTLSPGRVIVEGLPSTDDHNAVNGIAEGPDGYLYTSIGDFPLEGLSGREKQTAARGAGLANSRLLGTIIRYRPDGSDMSILARGIRNVFDLEFDNQGGLWGVDNDGITLRGLKLEEVLHIAEGDDFGFPRVGTYDPERTTPPVTSLPDTRGSAGVEWAPRIGLGRGLLVGSRQKLEYVHVARDEHGYYVPDRDPSEPADIVLEVPNGFVTVVEADSDGRLWIGTYGIGFSQSNELAVFTAAA